MPVYAFKCVLGKNSCRFVGKPQLTLQRNKKKTKSLFKRSNKSMYYNLTNSTQIVNLQKLASTTWKDSTINDSKETRSMQLFNTEFQIRKNNKVH